MDLAKATGSGFSSHHHRCSHLRVNKELKQVRCQPQRERHLNMYLRPPAIISRLLQVVPLAKCPPTFLDKIVEWFGLEEKIENLTQGAYDVDLTVTQIISRDRKDENGYEMHENEKCTCKAY